MDSERNLYKDLEEFLQSLNCSLAGVENVSGFGESYLVKFVNRGEIDSEEVKKKINGFFNSRWAKSQIFG